VAKVIGLVMGDEPLVEHALVERIDAEPAVHAERVIIGGTAERHIGKHHVIFDRISHLVPHFRTYLRAAALAGANIVNDPFAVSDDKFFALSLAARLGLNVPRAALLPQKGYGYGVDPARSLGNLQFPLLWDEIAHYVGFPALLRPARASDMSPQPVGDVGAFIGAFDHTWDSPTMLQAEVPGVCARLRCVCVGGERAVAFELGNAANGSAVDGTFHEAIEAALTISRALGLALNAVDMVVTETKAWVVDAVDPVPHLAPHTLGAEPFDKVMDRLAEHLISSARSEKRTIEAHAWATQL
jgi:hypothetical protein